MQHHYLAPEGWPYLIAAAAATLIAGLFQIWLLLPGGLLLLFFAFFFRDPPRHPVTQPESWLSPADGRVMAVVPWQESGSPSRPQIKITIFLSIFNVHINRAPMDGLLTGQDYRPGRFLPAFKPHVSELNEQNRMIFSHDQITFAVHQITGFLARRVVSDLQIGQTVRQGQRVGMIKFGSCTELIIPADSIVNVQTGQKVVAGRTVLAVRKEASS